MRLIKAALSSLLTDAVDDELIEANPALQVGRKKRRAGAVTASERVRSVRPMTRGSSGTRFLDAAQTRVALLRVLRDPREDGSTPGRGFGAEAG